MSVTDDQLDKLEVVIAAAISGITITRKPGHSKKLPPDALPHCFLHTPSGTVEPRRTAMSEQSQTSRSPGFRGMTPVKVGK